MVFASKYEVGDIVAYHYERQPDPNINVLEIMEINPVVCYTGTQIFYLVRAIFINKEGGKSKWVISHSIGSVSGKSGWRKYREDELSPINPEVVKFIKKKTKIKL